MLLAERRRLLRGNICGAHDFERDARRGHVHLIKHGPVQLIGGPEGGLSITEPSLLFMPRSNAHTLIANDRDGADVVCAANQFGAGGATPISDSLPALVIVPLSELPGAQPLLELLFEEAFSQHCVGARPRWTACARSFSSVCCAGVWTAASPKAAHCLGWRTHVWPRP